MDVLPIPELAKDDENRTLSAGAVSHIASQARQMIENYFQQRGKDISNVDESVPARIVIRYLNRLAEESYQISQLPEAEQSLAFGKFVSDAEKKITHSLTASYFLAKLIANNDMVIPTGLDEAGNKLPMTEGIITKADAADLIKPLKAAISYSGHTLGVYTAHTQSRRQPLSDKLAGHGPSGTLMVFRNSVRALIPYSNNEFSEAKSEAIKAYLGGFHAGKRAEHPLINPEMEKGIGLANP